MDTEGLGGAVGQQRASPSPPPPRSFYEARGRLRECRLALSPEASSVVQKRIHVKIDRSKKELSLRDVLDKIKEIQDANPDLDVFFDGDEYAICSRPRKSSSSS